VFLLLLLGAALGYNNVSISYRDYANAYYRDFFYYTREKRGEAGLIMSRPVDCQLDKRANLCTPFSPRDVMLSGWVGDDDGTFNGLRGCMKKVIFSAWDGYTNFGCDIGGYRGPDAPNKQVQHISSHNYSTHPRSPAMLISSFFGCIFHHWGFCVCFLYSCSFAGPSTDRSCR
jgi:hypothetical protein